MNLLKIGEIGYLGSDEPWAALAIVEKLQDYFGGILAKDAKADRYTYLSLPQLNHEIAKAKADLGLSFGLVTTVNPEDIGVSDTFGPEASVEVFQALKEFIAASDLFDASWKKQTEAKKALNAVTGYYSGLIDDIRRETLFLRGSLILTCAAEKSYFGITGVGSFAPGGDMQDIGIANTYLRRYLTLGLMNVAPADDDAQSIRSKRKLASQEEKPSKGATESTPKERRLMNVVPAYEYWTEKPSEGVKESTPKERSTPRKPAPRKSTTRARKPRPPTSENG